MTLEDFKNQHHLKSRDLAIFNSEEAILYTIKDSEVNLNTILQFEKLHGIELPSEYKEFCQSFGGGQFGFLTILSLDEFGEFYLGNLDLEFFKSKELMPFCDDDSGGFFCFKIKNNECSNEIYHIYLGDLTIEKSTVNGFFEFVLEYAYDGF